MSFPYRNIMVAVDNSECSNRAVELAVELARTGGARLTGDHVYAGRLHDARFRQMEPGLPERYQREDLLSRQRRIHDDLIARGLGIISDSYLRLVQQKCREAGISVEVKALEGRNYAELVKDTRASGYDLVILGAHGLGRADRSIVGSVRERVARLVECDLLVVREARPPGSGWLVVAIDGSPHSFAALELALDLAGTYDCPVFGIAAYDPFFHGAAFASIAGVLTEEASKLFRFREQERLHDEVIDSGLAKVYGSHLLRARELAEQRGLSLETRVLEGKPFEAICSFVEELRPALLLVGRAGIHHEEGVTLGSTAENLLRLSSCNVLVANVRDGGVTAEANRAGSSEDDREIAWSEEAKARLQRIPFFARNMARKRIESLARENGCRVITIEVYEDFRRHMGM